MKPILEIQHISKEFYIGGEQQSYLSLRDVISNPFKKLRRPPKQLFKALDDISFTVMPGESVGIIGGNGAGKSTLFKILSSITPPTSGRIICRGRIASLLEVGTGFHMELTGRENIYMNGSILGMRKAEITKHFDEIVDFSGVEKFLDTPLKRYSSGMQLRLAFAVAAHLEPEILVIDEVLAVGDSEFQKKCLGKMEEVSRSGRTVLFVSHNMPAVKNLCTKGVVLEKGKLLIDGTIDQAVGLYLNNNTTNVSVWTARENKSKEVYFSRIELEVIGEQPSLKMRIKCMLDCNSSFPKSFIAFYIGSIDSVSLMEAVPSYEPYIEFAGVNSQIAVSTEINLPQLIPGVYTLGVWLGSNHSHTLDWQKEILTFQIVDSPIIERTVDFPKHAGFISTGARIVEVTNNN